MVDEFAIEVKHLVTHYGNRQVLDDINMSVRKGEIMVIMGGSGSGKSTLLRFLLGLNRPTSGAIRLLGKDITKLNSQEMHRLRKDMGVAFQGGALFSSMSVGENVELPLREHTKLDEKTIRIMSRMKLELVNLAGFEKFMPAELSGGMIKRAALARAIALEPMLIMYDEPFTGLDPISKGVIAKLIRELNINLGITSIVVSHDVIDTCAISDYAYLLGSGRVIGQGTPDEVRQSASEHVRQFMDGLPDGPVPYQYPAPDYVRDLLGEEDS